MQHRSTAPTFHARGRIGLVAGALLLALAPGCMTPGSDGGSGGAAAAPAAQAYKYLLPEFSPGVTTLGDFAQRALFASAMPVFTLKVVFDDGGVQQMKIADFALAHADWQSWKVKAYTPGFKLPSATPNESDFHKWIATTWVDKGGEVGVVIEPPIDPNKLREPR